MDTTLPASATEDAETAHADTHAEDAKTAESVRQFFDASNSSMMGGWT